MNDFEIIKTEKAIIYKPKNYPGPIAIDIKPSEELKEYHKNSSIHVEWGGNIRYMTSDGRNVNIADELNRIENGMD